MVIPTTLNYHKCHFHKFGCIQLYYRKFSYDEDDIEEREHECQKPQPNHCQNETYWYNEMNRQLEEKFHIGMELPVVFIDIGHKKNPTRMSQANKNISLKKQRSSGILQ